METDNSVRMHTHRKIENLIVLNLASATISVQARSANAWKKAIKQSYPNVIIGSQKAVANLNMKV